MYKLKGGLPYNTDWQGTIQASYAVMRQLLLKIFSKTVWPIKAKVHVEPPSEGGMKVCMNGPGHMTKMAAMLYMVKNFENLLQNQKSTQEELETWQ